MKATNDYVSRLMTQLRIEALEQRLEQLGHRRKEDLGAMAGEKVNRGSALTRAELAAYLGVSTRKLQRMEAAGTLRRCPNLGTVVRYAARDVLRLASAS